MSPSRHSSSDTPGRRWPVIIAWLLAVGALTAFAIVLIGGGSTTTVVRTVIVRTGTGSASVAEDTEQGAVLAAEAVYARDLKDQWSTSLGYRIFSFTPSAVTVETIERVLPRVKRRHTMWFAWNIHVAYQDGQWLEVGELDSPANTPPFWTRPPAILQELKPWPPA